MKRIVIILLFIATFVLSLDSNAQGKLFSKKENLQDFNDKTMMVVLENTSYTDMYLKDAIEKNWNISKYEFITPDKFEEIKGDDSYYFLLRVKGIFKKEREPGIEYIALYKGGPNKVGHISQMNEIISLPYQALDDGDADNSHFLSAYVATIQNHVLRIQRKVIAAYMGILWYSNRLQDVVNGKILINESDLSEKVSKQEVLNMIGKSCSIVSEDDICDALENRNKNTYVTLSIAPTVPQIGSYCYKLVFNTESNEIYYYRKQKITQNSPKGFLKEDLKKIAIYFNK